MVHVHSRWTTLLCLTLVAQLVRPQSISTTSSCPARCDSTLSNPTAWTYYNDFGQLDNCNATVLFQTNIYNEMTDGRRFYYRSCSVSDGTTGRDGGDEPNITVPASGSSLSAKLFRKQALSMNSTTPSPALLQFVTWNSGGDVDVTTAGSALTALRDNIDQFKGSVLFARAQSVVSGIYVGSQIDKASAATAITNFMQQLPANPLGGSAIQTCNQSIETPSSQYFGVVYYQSTNASQTQAALRSWSDGKCVTGDKASAWNSVAIGILPGTAVSISPLKRSSRLAKRGDCSYIQAQSGDGCWALAQRCGISQDDLESYNGGPDFCNSVVPDQYVCCSSGGLPDFSPQPNADGSCFVYTVVADDNCAAIAAAHQMTAQDIEGRNTETWGWQGCDNLWIGMRMCLSTGDPPFPANVPNAVCGPQVNDTVPNSDPSTWADLNPCALNACCDVFGQCGITSDFCTIDPADTGNPGTAQPDSNGCISNCGTDIVAGPPVASFERVGYYEAFNVDRPCGHVSVNAIPDRYTIVHWAFASLSADYQPSVSPYEAAWADFKAITRFKKVVSFGGWSFSTSPSSYDILRSGVTEENRQTLANNIASFVKSEGLDGVDIDWEYPGAPDSEGEDIPVDDPESANNYLEFLELLRAALPDHSISIALPASYWYLKAFPAQQMAPLLNYFIYMTYDLHGQWDYGNTFTNPGCPNGNCLRSQINQTETASALSMLTKAGVPANKIMLGQPLYGRTFQMSDAGCTTAECTFTGPDSGALPGECTGTPGYLSNDEIYGIINSGKYSLEFYDDPIVGNILVYDDVQWVSWMSQATYDSRSEWAQGLGFAGTSDWAIDLNVTGGIGDSGSGDGTGSGVVFIDPSVFDDPGASVACQPPCTFVFPPWTLPYTTTITPTPLTLTVTEEWPSVSTLSGMVTSMVYLSKTTATTVSFPPITTTEIPLWNVVWTDTDDPIIPLTSSIEPSAVTMSQQSTVITTSGTTTTIGGLWWSLSLGPYPTVPPTASGPSPSTTPLPPPPSSCSACPPSLTAQVGPPGPTCVSGCGKQCSTNCDPSQSLDLGGSCVGLLCNLCIGIGCPGGGNCIGLGCSGGGGAGGDDEPESCSESSTVTDCSVDCDVGPDSDGDLTTSCWSTTCSDHVGCRSTGSTTTDETTTACPSELPYTPTFGADGQIPMMGNGDDAGDIIYAGLIGPNPTYDPSNTGTGASTPSATAVPFITYAVYNDDDCQDELVQFTLTADNSDCYTPYDHAEWTSMQAKNYAGIGSDPIWIVYPLNNCNESTDTYMISGLTIGCISDFEATSEDGNQENFVPGAIRWLSN